MLASVEWVFLSTGLRRSHGNGTTQGSVAKFCSAVVWIAVRSHRPLHSTSQWLARAFWFLTSKVVAHEANLCHFSTSFPLFHGADTISHTLVLVSAHVLSRVNWPWQVWAHVSVHKDLLIQLSKAALLWTAETQNMGFVPGWFGLLWNAKGKLNACCFLVVFFDFFWHPITFSAILKCEHPAELVCFCEHSQMHLTPCRNHCQCSYIHVFIYKRRAFFQFVEEWSRSMRYVVAGSMSWCWRISALCGLEVVPVDSKLERTERCSSCLWSLCAELCLLEA